MVREGSDLCLIQALTLLTSAMNEEFHKNLTHDIWSPDRDWSLNTPSYEWMSMEQGGMILTGENWSIGRETLYSVGGRWMNEYGVMVEWYWQGKTEVEREKHYTAWVVDEWMSMEQWWNDTDRGKLNYWEKNIIQCGW